MKPNCYFLLLCISTLLCFSSCDKKEPEPPQPPQLTPMTTTGAETLSFLKDGEVWIADRRAFSPEARITTSGGFAVSTSKKLGPNDKELFNLGIFLLDFEERTYYNITRPIRGGFYPSVDSIAYCPHVLEPVSEYEVVSLSPTDSFNYLDITHLDFSGNFNIIAGTFQLRLAYVGNEGECTDTILLTDGRFDLEFDWTP